MRPIPLLLILAIAAAACTSDKADELKPAPVPPATTSISDSALRALAAAPGFTYYQNRPDTLLGNNQNAHFQFIRVRFNATAASALGADGRLPLGTTFPQGSIIVKEIYARKGQAPGAQAILYKSATDRHARRGWVWTEYYEPGGQPIAAAADTGRLCTGCHYAAPNRDGLRTFEVH